jgi:hypothetical protein
MNRRGDRNLFGFVLTIAARSRLVRIRCYSPSGNQPIFGAAPDGRQEKSSSGKIAGCL